MKSLINYRMKHKAKHELEYLKGLTKAHTIYNMPTPKADEAFKQYLLDSIAWLDEGAES